MRVFIQGDGSILTIDGVQLIEADGHRTTWRASHVVPEGWLKRATFKLLRFCCGERGVVAGWCRQWQGPWQVRFAETPWRVEYRHQSRRVCIAWEIDQLNGRLAGE